MCQITLKSVAAFLLLMTTFSVSGDVVGKVDVKSVNVPEVVRSVEIRGGHTLEYVKTSEGMVSKRIVFKEGGEMPLMLHSPLRRAEADFTAPFSEMFETWDGVTFDWIPEGWQDISKADPPHVAPAERSLNFTWQVEPAGFDVALEGNYSARVQNCFYTDPNDNTQLVNEPQDEWLITPRVSITENNVLYFYLGYHPSWTLLNFEEWTFGNVNNIMEVQISEDGGETWTKVWDCLEDAYSYSNKELLEDLQSLTVMWVPFRINLSEYEGKDINVAFRYVGIDGESMRIDAVSIKRPEPQAYYMVPTGSFYKGFSPEFDMPETKTLLYGAYGDCTWLNYSNMDCEAFEWSYSTNSEEVFTSEEVDLSYYCYPGNYDVPTLKATAEYGQPSTFKSDYEYIRMGGNNTETDDEGKVIEYGACNYLIDNSIGVYEIEGSYVFGTGSEELWTSWYALEGRTATLSAICNYFPKPNHTYYFSKVWVNVIVDATADAEFVLEALDEQDGGIDIEPFAIAKCKGGDITYSTVDGQRYATLMFDFGGPVTVENGMMLKLSGFNDEANVKDFVALNQFYPNSDGLNYAYAFVTVSDGSGSVDSLVSGSSLVTGIGALNTAFCFNMNATFTWLECSNTDFYAPEEQTSKGFKFMSEFGADDFKVEGEGVNDWITYKFGAFDSETSTQVITFTVSANPGAFRESVVKVSVPGSSKNITISQDASSGVSQVGSGGFSVSMRGDDLVIEGADEGFELYSSAGLLLSRVPAGSGIAIVDMSDYPGGVYVVKSSRGEIKKIVK